MVRRLMTAITIIAIAASTHAQGVIQTAQIESKVAINTIDSSKIQPVWPGKSSKVDSDKFIALLILKDKYKYGYLASMISATSFDVIWPLLGFDHRIIFEKDYPKKITLIDSNSIIKKPDSIAVSIIDTDWHNKPKSTHSDTLILTNGLAHDTDSKNFIDSFINKLNSLQEVKKNKEGYLLNVMYLKPGVWSDTIKTTMRYFNSFLLKDSALVDVRMFFSDTIIEVKNLSKSNKLILDKKRRYKKKKFTMIQWRTQEFENIVVYEMETEKHRSKDELEHLQASKAIGNDY